MVYNIERWSLTRIISLNKLKPSNREPSSSAPLFDQQTVRLKPDIHIYLSQLFNKNIFLFLRKIVRPVLQKMSYNLLIPQWSDFVKSQIIMRHCGLIISVTNNHETHWSHLVTNKRETQCSHLVTNNRETQRSYLVTNNRETQCHI